MIITLPENIQLIGSKTSNALLLQNTQLSQKEDSTAQLALYSHLTDSVLRSKIEPEQGIFIAESRKVIERAYAAGAEPLSFLLEEKWLSDMAECIERFEKDYPERPVFIAPREALMQLAGYDVTRGALAAFKRPPLPDVETLLENAHLVAVLENITNHTNVGAIFRSAAALGVDAVLVNDTCYDPLYRRAIRVSMGTVFQVPWTRIPNRPQQRKQAGPPSVDLTSLKNAGFSTFAMALSSNSYSLDDSKLKGVQKRALILGTEGDGLTSQTIANADYVVKIPMAAGVDSLNVAAASAVAFWEMRQTI